MTTKITCAHCHKPIQRSPLTGAWVHIHGGRRCELPTIAYASPGKTAR
jgi:hypothetical protein